MSTPDVPPGDSPISRPSRASARRGAITSVVANWLVPLLVFHLVRPHVSSDAVALVISAAIPVVWTAGRLVVQRRVDPIGLLSIAAFALGIVGLVLFGGNSFAFKIREPALTGFLGLVCLGSLVISRPLVLPLIRGQVPAGTTSAALHRAAMGITGIAGVTLLVHAAVLIGLAATVSTSEFLALQQPVGLPILALGIGALMLRKQLAQRSQTTQRRHPGPGAGGELGGRAAPAGESEAPRPDDPAAGQS